MWRLGQESAAVERGEQPLGRQQPAAAHLGLGLGLGLGFGLGFGFGLGLGFGLGFEPSEYSHSSKRNRQ